MFDTHCHLNIEALQKRLDSVISMAMAVGIEKILIPGVTIESSKSAIEIAEKHSNIYAGIGIHPTDEKKTPELQNSNQKIINDLNELKKLITHSKVVAIGEIGLDYFVKNKDEGVRSEEEKEIQKELLIEQLKLAYQYKKAVIIHNRESKEDLLRILSENWDDSFSRKMVFHCCEPDMDLLNFAKEKGIYIGIDGDITYKKSKQAFVRMIPLEMLVLETDSPFLVPEPLKSQKIFPNEPKNLNLISSYVSHLLELNKDEFEKQVWKNSNELFFD